MRKFGYMFLAAALSVAMISCNKDEGKGGEPGPDPDPTPALTGHVMPKSIEMSDVITATYTMVGDKISKINMQSSPSQGSENVDITVAYADGKCTASFFNPNDDATVSCVYTLNADGYAISAVMHYDEEVATFGEHMFEYDANKMLTKVTDLSDKDTTGPIVVFSATYNQKELKTINIGDTPTEVISSKVVNNCAIDPTYFFVSSPGEGLDPFNMAVLCDLLPHPAYQPLEFIVESDKAAVALGIADGKITSYDIKAIGFGLIFKY